MTYGFHRESVKRRTVYFSRILRSPKARTSFTFALARLRAFGVFAAFGCVGIVAGCLATAMIRAVLERYEVLASLCRIFCHRALRRRRRGASKPRFRPCGHRARSRHDACPGACDLRSSAFRPGSSVLVVTMLLLALAVLALPCARLRDAACNARHGRRCELVAFLLARAVSWRPSSEGRG